MSIQEELENINKTCNSPKEMQEALYELNKKYPNEPGILFNLVIVDCAIDEGEGRPNYSDYINRMKRISKLDRLHSPLCTFQIVRFYYKAKDYKTAKKYLLKIIDDKTFLPESYAILVELNINLKEDLDYSLELINKVIDYNIDNENDEINENYYYLKGDLLANLEKWDELKEYANRLLLLSKDPIGPRFYILRCLVEEYKVNKTSDIKNSIKENILSIIKYSSDSQFIFQFILDCAKFIRDNDLIEEIVNSCEFINAPVKPSIIFLHCYYDFKSNNENIEDISLEEKESKEKEGRGYLLDQLEEHPDNPYTNFTFGSQLIENSFHIEDSRVALPHLLKIRECEKEYNFESYRLIMRCYLNLRMFKEAFEESLFYLEKYNNPEVYTYLSSLCLACGYGYDKAVEYLKLGYENKGMTKLDYTNSLIDLISCYDKDNFNIYKSLSHKIDKNDFSMYGVKKVLIDSVFGYSKNIYKLNTKNFLLKMDSLMDLKDDPCLYSFIGMYFYLKNKKELSEYYFNKGFKAFSENNDECLCPVGYFAYSKYLFNTDLDKAKTELLVGYHIMKDKPTLVSGQFILVLGYFYKYYNLDIDKELLLSYLTNDYYFKRYDLARYYLLYLLDSSKENEELLNEALNNSPKMIKKYYEKHKCEDKFIPLIVNS